MKCQKIFAVSFALLASIAQATKAQPNPAQPNPTQPNPTQLNTPPSNTTPPSPDWLKRIGRSYQGEFWKNGKIVHGSTLFYLSDQTGLTGMYITQIDGNLIAGDLTNCQVKQERTIHCLWREPNQIGEFEATFSPDFLSFKGSETVQGSSEPHPWRGEHDRNGATVSP